MKKTINQIFSEGINTEEFNRGLRYLDKHKPEKAAAVFKKLLRHREYKEAWLNLGVAYKWMNNYDKVKECFLKAASAEVPFSDGKFTKIYPTAVNNLGLLAFTFEQDDAAIAFYKHVLEDDPLNYEAIWNLSLASLRKYCSNKESDLALSWIYYTYRFKRNNAETLKSDRHDMQMWDFKTKYPEESIVVLVEQGMGDSMMFGRYLPELYKYFDKVFVQCTPEMRWLFTDHHPIQEISECDAKFAIPMASLGRILDYVPKGDYLAYKRIAKVPNGVLDIGCVWQGSKGHVNDRNRSVQAGYFDKLKKYGNLYTIGPGEKRKGYTHLDAKTWEDTANNLSKLDLVITVDTSIAHFCGTIGMPCWIIMPMYDTDFRWGDSSMGHKNIWYDSVKVIRNPGDWTKSFDEIESMLKCWK